MVHIKKSLKNKKRKKKKKVSWVMYTARSCLDAQALKNAHVIACPL